MFKELLITPIVTTGSTYLFDKYPHNYLVLFLGTLAMTMAIQLVLEGRAPYQSNRKNLEDFSEL